MNQPASEPTIPFEFTGTAREYFGIWIVNILLIIITLGIYTAWAKVRTHRYFYGNTILAGSPFDYLASPIAILKGWAIAIAVFIVYSVSTELMPMTAFLWIPLLLVGLPWVIVRAMRFRARYSSWRNIRFGFRKAYGEAARVFLLYPFLMIITLGLFLPYYYFGISRFLVANSGYGTAAFTFHATAKEFYKIFLAPVLVLLVVMGLVYAVSYPQIKALTDQIEAAQNQAVNAEEEEEADESMYSEVLQENSDAGYAESEAQHQQTDNDPHQAYLEQHAEMMEQTMSELDANAEYADGSGDMEENPDAGSGDEEYADEEAAYQAEQAAHAAAQAALDGADDEMDLPAMMQSFMLVMLISFVLYLVFIAYIQARIWNLFYNNTQLAGHRFISSVRARDIAWLYASNLVVISITFGLMIPWAKIRLARYRASKLLLQPSGSLDGFTQAQLEKVSALGEELGDVFDLDIGI